MSSWVNLMGTKLKDMTFSIGVSSIIKGRPFCIQRRAVNNNDSA